MRLGLEVDVSVRVDVAPDVLTWAVERAGWDEAAIERRAPYLENWRSGARKPTLKQLEQFAANTHTPFGLLFLPEPPVEEVPIPDCRTMGNKAVARPSADLLDTIYLCQNRQDWYRTYAQEQKLPAPQFVGSATLASNPERVAAQMRQALHFEVSERTEFPSWERALRGLIDRVETLGVLVMVNGIAGTNTHRKLDPEEFRGFALSDHWAPLIFVNGADTKAAQIFTLIHELAHIWLGASALSDADMTADHPVSAERWCNQVAAEVLLPVTALRTESQGSASSDELARLARRFKVSTLVVLKSIVDAGLLPWEKYRESYAQEINHGLSLLAEKREDNSGGNYYNTQPLRLSRRFGRAVVANTLEGATSYRDAYQLLGMKKTDTFEQAVCLVGEEFAQRLSGFGIGQREGGGEVVEQPLAEVRGLAPRQ